MTPSPDVSIGLFLTTNRTAGQSEDDVYARALALAAEAERAGLDDLWVTEHHFSDSSLSPSALNLASFLLGRTSTIAVGTAVTLLPLHSPVHVAEQAALLDRIGEGRFRLGVGRGAPLVDNDVFAGGPDRWREGFFEALDLVRAAFTGPVHGGTARYDFPEVAVVPAPRGADGPPVYVATGSPEPAAEVASRGLPLMLFFDKSARNKRELVALHAERAAAAGLPRTGYDHVFALFAQVTGGEEESRALLLERARHMVETSADARWMAGTERRTIPPDQREEAIRQTAEGLLATQAVGDVETCVRRLVEHLTVSGCRHVMCQVELSGGVDSSVQNLKRLVGDVFPEVRRRVAAAGRPA
ncbi:LLM class flavin-dependent oxidoreductase [Streptomyces sp. XM4193]|uniref:LLM class flavin-dependent oxidoreductase n=1 Tax=Streptomyces sp. XM4193 TaxID=2929782 RepID=UPI001FFAE3FD|nr:LLM class flavin-dependent oxidoreductase [Streptomyces sp. XM4193]MCK1794770.1 LLM class flavin-dependent oxidoreductase [Streptomyces sp. XM4193]